MKFVSYEYDSGVKIGAIKDEGIIDLSDAGKSIKEILAIGPLDNLIDVAEGRSPSINIDQVVLHQVIPDAGRIICVGRNYQEHALELGAVAPKKPLLFMRTPQSLVGHLQSVVKPKVSQQYDFEGELAIVIGRGGRYIDKNNALNHIAGYCCFLDGSVRDFQQDSITAGKNFDSSGACGPWLIPANEISDPQDLIIQTRINGNLMQDGKTGDMIFTIAEIISYISMFTYLEPGDVIATGSPSGVGAGRTPPIWLESDDIIEIEISNVGTLSNKVKIET